MLWLVGCSQDKRAAIRGLAPGLLVALALATLWLLPGPAVAVSPSPALLERAARDGALAARVAAFERHARERGVDAPLRPAKVAVQDARGEVRVRTRKATSSTGELKTLALLVDFPDREHIVSASWFDGLLFADAFGPRSLRGYFREVSYGSATRPGLLDVVTDDPPSSLGGWLRLPGTLASYVAGGDNGTGSYPGNAQKMVEDAVAAADPRVDFSVYDTNRDGFVDNLIVVHAGRGAEYTGSPGDLWSHQWETSRPLAVDGVFVSSYSTEPEYWRVAGDMTVGVFAHEIGHVLGLPDLYDRDFSSAGVGVWSLMGAGSWNGDDGDSPSRPDAWCSSLLGWLQPQTVAGPPAARSLAPVGGSRTAGAVRLLPADRAHDSEYFLVENRQRVGTDVGLPDGGMLVWHVDESRAGDDDGNDDETHKLVDLEEAGGAQDLDFPFTVGSDDDPFPGSAGARAFTDTTRPDARTYAGRASGVVIDEVVEAGGVVTARFGVVQPTDASAPVVRVVGARNGGHYRRDTTLTVVAVDEPGGSGIGFVTYALDGGPTHAVEGSTADVVVPAVPNAVHVLVCGTVDRVGNASSLRRFTIVTDTHGPVGAGRSVSGRRNRPLAVPYKLSDAMSPRIADVRVIVKASSGKTVEVFTPGPRVTRRSGRLYFFRWRPVARGAYTYRVYGRDAAGNAQSVAGRGLITVR